MLVSILQSAGENPEGACQAQRELARLAGEGVRAEASVWESLEEALAYAREAGIEKVLCAGETVRELTGKEAGL